MSAHDLDAILKDHAESTARADVSHFTDESVGEIISHAAHQQRRRRAYRSTAAVAAAVALITPAALYLAEPRGSQDSTQVVAAPVPSESNQSATAQVPLVNRFPILNRDTVFESPTHHAKLQPLMQACADKMGIDYEPRAPFDWNAPPLSYEELSKSLAYDVSTARDKSHTVCKRQVLMEHFGSHQATEEKYYKKLRKLSALHTQVADEVRDDPAVQAVTTAAGPCIRDGLAKGGWDKGREPDTRYPDPDPRDVIRDECQKSAGYYAVVQEVAERIDKRIARENGGYLAAIDKLEQDLVDSLTK